MAIDIIYQFLQKVDNDPKLKQQFVQALQTKNKQQAKQNIFKLANSLGYQFSKDELWTEIEKTVKEHHAKKDSEEISEEHLEAIAGGSIGNKISNLVNILVGSKGNISARSWFENNTF